MDEIRTVMVVWTEKGNNLIKLRNECREQDKREVMNRDTLKQGQKDGC